MPVPAFSAGKPTETSVDVVNQWMRSQPWWQQIKGNADKLNDQQKKLILQKAQESGVAVDEGDMEVDPAGNFNPKGHKLRNTLIVAGIAGATIATMGAAGAFAGAAGAAGGAAGAGGAGAAVGAGAGAGVAGGFGAGGLTATSLGLGTTAGLGTAGAVGAGAAAAGGAGVLGSTALGSGAVAPIAGGTGLGAGAAGAGTAGTLGTMSKVGSILSGGKGTSGYLDTAGKVANALGDYSAGRQADRMHEAQFGQGQDRNIIDLYQAQQQAANSENTFGLNKVNAGLGIGNLDLSQKQFSLNAPGQRASNSVRGDVLANAQDARVSGISPNTPVPNITGGLRPSMFSANTRALGGEMSAQALASQKAGDTFAPLPTLPDFVRPPAAPSLSAVPQAGAADSWLNTAATLGSLGGAMGAIPYKKKKPQDVVYDDQYNTGGN